MVSDMLVVGLSVCPKKKTGKSTKPDKKIYLLALAICWMMAKTNFKNLKSG